MTTILSQAGVSLADIYQVRGSIAGIETLQSREISLVHEMGATVFSERLAGTMNRSTTGAILQSVTWDNEIADLGLVPSRILGVLVFCDSGLQARVAHATVSVRQVLGGREVPIFAWENGANAVQMRIRDDDGAAAEVSGLDNVYSATMPSMLIGDDQPTPVAEIAFRGESAAFGAGNITVTMVLYRAFAQTLRPSSYGLPIPGW